MTHIDEDQLALIAIGDVRPSDSEAAHFADCAACAQELAELSGVVALSRSSEPQQLLTPAPEVWSRIRTELELDGAPERQANIVSRRRKAKRGRWRTRVVVPVTVAALVVGVVAGTGIGVWWQSAQTTNAGIVVAGAQLAPFPGWPDARGSAVVERLADGSQQVIVDVDPAAFSVPSDGTLREVWLIRSDGTGLVSIGFLGGVEGRFDIPAGIDLGQYSLVDVSAEKDDGDATHSGDSIVRGELRSI